MNSDLQRMVTPQVPTVQSAPDPTTGLSWNTKRIGIDLLNDSLKNDLVSIQSTLNTANATLNRIQKLVNTVLQPVISILRSVENPFASLIQELVSEAQKIIQAFDSQGIFVLDMVSDKLTNSATTNTLFLINAGQNLKSYEKQFNQAILTARAASHDPDLVAQAGLKDDGNGNLIKDPESNRNQDIRMTPQEAGRAGQTALSLANALTWIKQYNLDAITVAEAVRTQFEQMVTAEMTVNQFTNHFIGSPAVTANEEDTLLPDQKKVYFQLPSLSNLVTQDQFKDFINNLFETGTDNFIMWNQGVAGVTWNSTKLRIAGDGNLGNTTDLAEKNRVIDLMNSVASQIADIDKSTSNLSDKKKQIYTVIENTLKDNTGTQLPHRMNLGAIQSISDDQKQAYTNALINILSDPNGDTNKQQLVRQFLITKAKQQLIKNADDFKKITKADVIDTYAGFSISKIIVDRLVTSLTDTYNTEVASVQRAIDFINTQLEFQGLISNSYTPTKAPRKTNNQPLRPPRMTTAAASTATSDSTNVNLSTQAQSQVTAILESVTEDLDDIDTSKEFVKALKARYSTLTSALSVKIRKSFSDLQSDLEAFQSSCAGNNQIDDSVVTAFHQIMKDIIQIKISFYPFQLNQVTVNKLKENTSGKTAKDQLDLESLYLDTIIGSNSNTPYNEINNYINNFVKVFQNANIDPFQLFELGFERNQSLANLQFQESSFNDRLDFLSYFSTISNKLFIAGVQTPSFFIANVNGSGFQTQIVEIFNALSQITQQNFDKLEQLRVKVLSDIAAIDQTASCQGNMSNIKVPDRIKQRNNDQIAQTNDLLNAATNRSQALQKTLASKIGEIQSANAKQNTNESAQLVKTINSIIDETGGFRFFLNPGNNQIEETSIFTDGSINQKITALNTRINKLKVGNLERDRTVADQLGDSNLRTQVFRNLSILKEQLATAPVADRPGIQQQIDYLNTINNTIIGTVDASVSQAFINNLQIIEEVNKGIVGVQRIIDEINTATNTNGSPLFTNAQKNLLFGAGASATSSLVKPGNPSNMSVADSVTATTFSPGVIVGGGDVMTDDDVITLFIQAAQNASIQQSITADDYNTFKTNLQSFLDQSFVLRTDSDYSKYVNFSSFLDSVLNKPAIPLAYHTRLDTLNKIKASLKMISPDDAKSQATQDHDDSFFGNGNWITPTTKENWVNDFISSLRDTGDIRRPIFIDDVSRSRAANATIGLIGGPAMGEAAQKSLDNIVSMGEMTAVFYVSASTDVQTVLKNIENLYRMLVKPEKFQAKLNEFAKRIAKNFEDLEGILADTSVRGIEDYFVHATEDAIERIKTSASFRDNTDQHCIDNYKPPTKPIRNDRWMSIKITDIYLIAYAFNAVQKFLDYIKNAFTVKLGLADLLQDMLDFINSRINLLKKIAAGISVMIELIDFIGNLNFEVATLRVDNVKSINQLEKSLRQASNFPAPFYAPNPDDPMYILAVVLIMPTSFYNASFSKWFHEKPALPAFSPQQAFMGAINNVGAGQTTITSTGITGASGGSGGGSGASAGTTDAGPLTTAGSSSLVV